MSTRKHREAANEECYKLYRTKETEMLTSPEDRDHDFLENNVSLFIVSLMKIEFL
jgi:hypothetical protein